MTAIDTYWVNFLNPLLTTKEYQKDLVCRKFLTIPKQGKNVATMVHKVMKRNRITSPSHCFPLMKSAHSPSEKEMIPMPYRFQILLDVLRYCYCLVRCQSLPDSFAIESCVGKQRIQQSDYYYDYFDYSFW